jgi:hypothetical protein
MKFIDLTGQKFNRLKPIKYLGKSKWLCLCDCGKNTIVTGKNLKRGHTKSCGCLNKEKGWRKNTRKDRWIQEEINILKEFFPNKGIKYCANKLNRSKKSVRAKAKTIGLHTSIRGYILKKEIIKIISSNRVLSICKIHGESEHHLYKNKILYCLVCKRLREFEKRKDPVNNYTQKLRSLMGQAIKRINGIYKPRRVGCFRNLSYDSKELCNHLNMIRKLQKNKCPCCKTLYDDNDKYQKSSIDHIIPIASAHTKEEIISLFAIDNLSLMCLSCNKSKNDSIYSEWIQKSNPYPSII